MEVSRISNISLLKIYIIQKKRMEFTFSNLSTKLFYIIWFWSQPEKTFPYTDLLCRIFPFMRKILLLICYITECIYIFHLNILNSYSTVAAYFSYNDIWEFKSLINFLSQQSVVFSLFFFLLRLLPKINISFLFTYNSEKIY